NCRCDLLKCGRAVETLAVRGKRRGCTVIVFCTASLGSAVGGFDEPSILLLISPNSERIAWADEYRNLASPHTAPRTICRRGTGTDSGRSGGSLVTIALISEAVSERT